MELNVTIYNADATQNGSLSLPEKIFGSAWNPNLVHDVITAMDANARTPLAHTKGRGEVRGGGKKPWRQKGTGRARHGSNRSPIWVGGGISFGPVKERDYSQKINKKAKHSALRSALSEKLRKDTILFVQAPSLTDPKTKTVKEMLIKLAGVKGFEALNSSRRNVALIVTPDANDTFMRSARNIGNIDVVPAMNLDVRDVMTYRTVIFVSPQESVHVLEQRLSPVSRTATTA